MTFHRMVVSVGLLVMTVSAVGAEMEHQDWLQAAQNPIADVFSVPLENNTHQNVAGGKQAQNVFNAQANYPFHLNERWNVITRTVLPIISQPGILTGEGRKGGIGDLRISAYLSSTQASDWIWGAGVVATAPTGSHASMETEKWCLGPALAAVRLHGKWVYGALYENIFDIAGESQMPGVNQMLLQPFVYYNFGERSYAVSAPTVTADWNGNSGDKWTIPIGAGVGRIFYAGSLPINTSIHYYHMIEKPRLGADWTLRLQAQILFGHPR